MPNSISYSRPVILVQAKENRDNIETFFKPTLAKLKQLENSTIECNSNLKIVCHTEISMCDEKMVSYLQGDSGAFCHMCFATRKSANDLICIMQGFEFEKDYETLQTIFNQLQSGEIKSKDKKGQNHKPLVEQDMNIHGVLHSKLRQSNIIPLKKF